MTLQSIKCAYINSQVLAESLPRNEVEMMQILTQQRAPLDLWQKVAVILCFSCV